VIVLFKQKSPANIVLLFLFGLLIKLPLFLYPKIIVAPATDGKLYTAFIDTINRTGSGQVIASVLALVSPLRAGPDGQLHDQRIPAYGAANLFCRPWLHAYYFLAAGLELYVGGTAFQYLRDPDVYPPFGLYNVSAGNGTI
jgi:hypothetical protein